MTTPSSLPDRLARLQTRRGWVFALIGAGLVAGSLPLIADLGLDSSFTALLPEDKPSVRDLEAVGDRIGGMSTLFVAIQSDDTEAMQRFAGVLVPRLEALHDPQVQSIDWNISAFEDFVTRHKHLYANVEDLEEVRDALQERLDFERARANPFFIQLEDEEPPDPAEVIERIRHRVEEGRSRAARFPGGYYVHPEGDLLAIFLRTSIRGGDVQSGAALINRVDALVRRMRPSRYAADMKVEYAGDIPHQREEHDAIARELKLAVGLTVGLVLLVILVFFRRVRAILLIGLALSVPVCVTFAFAEVAVDYLNTSTAFLGSIVIGNGINPQIIWLARYFELRRRGMAMEEALAETHRTTWAATITASLAAAIAYGSLIITDFRGFEEFGVIGGVGMVLCWLGAFTVLPALTAISERVLPLYRGAPPSRGGLYGVLFARLVVSAPRALTLICIALTVAGIGLVVKAVIDDPIEYDFRNLRSVREGSTRATVLNGRIKEIVGGAGLGQANLFLLDTPEQAERLRTELERRRDRQHAPYGRVRTIRDLLPKDQEQKIPIANEIRELMADARRFASDEDRARLDDNAIPEDIAPLTAAELPMDVARPFTERNGSRGRIVLVEQREGESLWDGQYLVDWAAALRAVRLEDGTRPPLAGSAPVFADMIEVIWVDGPKAVAASLLATLLLVIVAFRDGRLRWLTMGSLVVGIVWMAGAMALFGMKLNFLNFVAFPITFGNGVDYGVNLARRYGVEAARGRGVVESMRTAIEETGGAVVLCSLTTVFGYLSLYVSDNRALNSFGAAMSISEITCVLAALVAMPAVLLWLGRRGAGPAPKNDAALTE